MKLLVRMVFVAGFLAASAQAFSFGFPSLPSLPDITAGSGGGEKADVEALATRDGVLKLRVNKATVSLAKGVAEIQHAVGKAAEAEKLEATLVEAQKNPSDVEQTKKLVSEVNNANDSLKNIDLNASMNKEEARKRLGKSLLYLGAGSLLDAQATLDAKNLITDITNGIKAVKASPASYGLSTISDLYSGLNTAKFVAETVPAQISTIAELIRGLKKYAQTNKIEVPSKQEMEALSKDMEKE